MGLFGRKVRDPLSARRKTVARLRKKGHLIEALKEQLALCEQPERELTDWITLAELARLGEQPRLELAARIESAKLSRAGREEWLALAEAAASAGTPEQRAEVLFRVADSHARCGECQQALGRCEEVLAAVPGHGAARRLRDLMVARLERAAAPAAPAPAPPPEPSTLAATEEQASSCASSERLRPSEEFAVEPTLDPSLVDFVCAPQPWPSILDSSSLTFTGQSSELGAELLALTEPLTVEPGAPLCRQGTQAHLLYCVDSGLVRLHRVRGEEQDLGTVTPGTFFGEVGAISNIPASCSAEAGEATTLRILNRRQLRPRRSSSLPQMITTLREWYLETTIGLCPLLSALAPEVMATVTDSVNWSVFEPGEVLAAQGQPVRLQVIVIGVAHVTWHSPAGDPLRLGFLTSGDLVGELNPSPVTVTARARTFALTLDLDQLGPLPDEAQADLQARTLACQAALEELVRETELEGAALEHDPEETLEEALGGEPTPTHLVEVEGLRGQRQREE